MGEVQFNISASSHVASVRNRDQWKNNGTKVVYFVALTFATTTQSRASDWNVLSIVLKIPLSSSQIRCFDLF
jgi:hypothetical protein